MIWESVAWVAVAVAALPLVQLGEAPIRSRWPTLWPVVRGVAPWIVGLGPAYLALVTGAVLERSFGLYGRGGMVGWVLAALLCVGGLAAVWVWRERLGAIAAGEDPTEVLLDEPRWALYRAAGVLWLGMWGLLVGFAVGGVEWALRARPWLATSRGDRTVWLTLIRFGISSLIFALTGNFWFTLISQAAGWTIIRPDESLKGKAP
ncbi:MAG: hypothetical protein WBZ24_09835 [Anaerolineales bacterium]